MTFKRIVSFIGRNGCFKASGLEIGNDKFNKVVTLEPITSKGEVGRAMLEIPKENIPDVIKELFAHLPQTEQMGLNVDLSIMCHPCPQKPADSLA